MSSKKNEEWNDGMKVKCKSIWSGILGWTYPGISCWVHCSKHHVKVSTERKSLYFPPEKYVIMGRIQELLLMTFWRVTWEWKQMCFDKQILNCSKILRDVQPAIVSNFFISTNQEGGRKIEHDICWTYSFIVVEWDYDESFIALRNSSGHEINVCFCGLLIVVLFSPKMMLAKFMYLAWSAWFSVMQ